MFSLAAVVINNLSIAQIAIYIVVVAAIVALVYIALKQFGVAIPPFVVQIFWVLVVLVAVVLAIKFAAGL